MRREDQADAVRELGAEPVVADLEQDLDPSVVDGSDAIVFAAGAGPGSGAERKETMDLRRRRRSWSTRPRRAASAAT